MMGDKKAVGFLEIIISLALISIAILGAWQVLEVGMMSVYKSNQEIIATNLARGLMAMIMAKPFDDVDDYNNYNETTPITIGGQIMNGQGGTPNYTGFSRSVVVKYVTEAMEESVTATDYKRVTVTVTAAGIANTVLVEVKVNL